MPTKQELLRQAILENDIAAFSKLIEGIDTETQLNCRNTSLIYAAAYGRTIMVQMLLDAGARIEARNQDGDTPLIAATAGGYIDTMKLLLEAGAKKEACDSRRNTPLALAAFAGHANAVQLLLKVGANKSALNAARETPRMRAMDKGHDEIVFILDYFGTFKYRLYAIGFNESVLDKKEKRLYDSFLCPISLEIINDPITISSGITYDRESLQKYFSSQHNPLTLKCPKTGILINRNELNNKTCFILKSIIDDFVSEQELEFEPRLELNTEDTATKLSSVGLFKQQQLLNWAMKETLAALQSYGLTAEMLLTWQPPTSEPSVFRNNHKMTLIYLIKDLRIDPVQAIQEINELNLLEAPALQRHYTKGLRRDHLLELRGLIDHSYPGHDELHGIYSVLDDCLDTKQMSVIAAIESIKSLSSSEQCELFKNFEID